MPFQPFDSNDFQSMHEVSGYSHSVQLEQKISDLRKELASFPEYNLDFFRKRIVRRPTMRGRQGLVFGPPRWDEKHWFLFNVGGDQDQVQLNIGMFPDHIRVGLGFQIGRQVSPKIPAFHVFQTFLGVRPPLPFRDAFLKVITDDSFLIEKYPSITDPGQIVSMLETYVVPADKEPVFVFIGAFWIPYQASSKQTDDFAKVFRALLPFYEELILAGGRYVFLPP